jgi:hypothetical protein
MKLTIIPVDGLVGKENYFFTGLDLSTSGISVGVHALQWYDIEGEIEFTTNSDRTKPQNELISELPAWATACVEIWNVAKADEEARIAAELEAAEAAAAEAAAEAAALGPIPSTTV